MATWLNKKFIKVTIKQFNNVVLFLFIFFLPTQFGKHFFLPSSYLSGVRVDYLAPTVYWLDFLIMMLGILNYQIVVRAVKKKRSLIFLFLILIATNLVFSQSKITSIYQYIKVAEFLLVFIIFRTRSLKPRPYLLALTVGGLMQLLLVVLQVINRHSLQGVFYYLGERYLSLSTPAVAKASWQGIEVLRPYGTFSHPNSLAGFYLLLYFFVVTNRKFRQENFLKSIFLFISSMLVFLSFSKIAILSCLVLSFSYYLTKQKLNKKCLFCLCARLITLSTVGLIFLTIKSDPLSLEKRYWLIKNSLVIISQNFFFGVGAGNYLVAQNQLLQNFPTFLNQPVHNIFLLFISQWGILTSGLIIYLSRSFIKAVYKNSLLIFLSILFTGFFDHYWLTLNQNLFLLAVVFASL